MDDTYNYKRLKPFFCNIHVQRIYLTYGLYTMYHTYHVKDALCSDCELLY